MYLNYLKLQFNHILFQWPRQPYTQFTWQTFNMTCRCRHKRPRGSTPPFWSRQDAIQNSEVAATCKLNTWHKLVLNLPMYDLRSPSMFACCSNCCKLILNFVECHICTSGFMITESQCKPNCNNSWISHGMPSVVPRPCGFVTWTMTFIQKALWRDTCCSLSQIILLKLMS